VVKPDPSPPRVISGSIERFSRSMRGHYQSHPRECRTVNSPPDNRLIPDRKLAPTILRILKRNTHSLPLILDFHGKSKHSALPRLACYRMLA